MKKIINGRLYDTDSPNAEKIGTYCNGVDDVFYCVKETLYRKINTDDYFISIEAGPLSEYGQPFTSGWKKHTDIAVINMEEAEEFALAKLEPDEYMSAFGTVEE